MSRSIAALTLALALPACTRTDRVPIRDGHVARDVVVHRYGGETVELSGPVVIRQPGVDVLTFQSAGETLTLHPLSVQSLTTSEPDTAATLAWIGVGVVLLAGVTAFALQPADAPDSRSDGTFDPHKALILGTFFGSGLWH